MSTSVPPENWSRYLLAASGVVIVFGIWLSLFTLGILVDTEPYRRAISQRGVFDLESETQQTNPDSLARGHTGRDTVRLRLSASPSAQQNTLRGDTASLIMDSVRSIIRSDSGHSVLLLPERASSSDTSRSTSIVDGSGAPTHSTFWAFIVVIFCFTPSNLALLCCTAGMLGAMGRRVVLSTQRNRDTVDQTFPVLSAILRGFFVYLTVISGILVLLENPILGTMSPGQYIRFAGLLSLLSFFVNYDPSLFVALLDRVRDRMKENTGDPSPPPSEDTSSANP